MDPTLHALLTARLDASDLDTEARAEVLAEAGPPASPAEQEQATPDVYLRSVTVEGFRGIGPAATLELPAQPGLTLVVGRNGSGKSSFAEGLELLMTARTKRWEGKTLGWTSAWQCLHHDGPTRLAASLVVGGQEAPVELAQSWERGVPYTDAADRHGVDALLARHGWASALQSFRPFLAYAELAAMFDKLTSLHAALSPILGLDDVEATSERLRARRLGLEQQVKALKATTGVLRGSLGAEDAREVELDALLAARKPDPEAIRAHLLAHPPGASAPGTSSAALRRVAAMDVPSDEALTEAFAALGAARKAESDAAVGDAAGALALADLLTRALAFRDPATLADDCPVCAATARLDDAWAQEAGVRAEALRAEARALTSAATAVRSAEGTWSSLLARLAAGETADVASPSLGEGHPAPEAGPEPDTALARAATLRATAAKAAHLLEQEDVAWRRVTEQTTAWLAAAERVATEAHNLQTLKRAETWTKDQGDTLRQERFAPIAAQAIANWNLLKHASSVELHDIAFTKSKQAIFDVRADGEEASALGVMSQGELLALSVSVFLPRAGLDESPFRFSVIDDPVQSMDPAKVDGLARVLAGAAATRQVVVFTHDDRLPEAVRRLKLPATVLQVNRRSRSQVAVNESRTPMRRHLDDAKHMALSEKIPVEIRQRVVPALCREALEAACAERARERGVRAGADPRDVDERIGAARTLRGQLGLALIDDSSDHEAITAAIAGLGAGANGTIDALNQGSHGKYQGAPMKLHTQTVDLIHEVMSA